jgi:hypothetical protein
VKIGAGSCLALAFIALGTTVVPAQSTQHLALKGYDPVAYFLVGAPMEGSPDVETVFDEVRYRGRRA